MSMPRLTKHAREVLDLAVSHLQTEAESYRADEMASQRAVGRQLDDAAEWLARFLKATKRPARRTKGAA